MYKQRITVFTPTYNRAHTLGRLYQSLRDQTFVDFEWLIIDDGSTDGTKSLIEKYITDKNLFPIHYHLKSNGGKHTAINVGLEKAQGELFFTADSDDYLTSDALQKVDRWAASLPKDDKFCGVVGNWGSSADKTPNTIFNQVWRDANLLERHAEFSDAPIDGERAWVFFTDIHKKYVYPVFENEKFMTEAVAWNRMAQDGYKVRVFNDIIYIYKYLPGGLSLSGGQLFIDNPKGYALWLKEKGLFLRYGVHKKFRMYYSYLSSQKHRLSKVEIADNIGASYRVILVLCLIYSLKSFYNGVHKCLRHHFS